MKRNYADFLAVGSLLLAVGGAFTCQPARGSSADAQDPYLVKQLPGVVWERVQQAEGIVVGGQPGSSVQMQVIFDVNCPFCALLYTFMRQKHPTVAVRWVPVAYLLPDSGPIAGAILAAPNPTASLDTDFSKYDFNGPASHGGYLMPKDQHYALPAANTAVQKEWERQWGGGTPTVFVKNQDGSVTRVLGFDKDAVNRLLKRRPQGLPAYQN